MAQVAPTSPAASLLELEQLRTERRLEQRWRSPTLAKNSHREFFAGVPDRVGFDGPQVAERIGACVVLGGKSRRDLLLFGNRLFFQGRELDPATGLYDFRNRWYDPESGRFLTPDPLGYPDGPNQYAAFLADPANNADPMGTIAESYWDGLSLSIDLASASANYRDGNYKSLALDAFGIVVDTAALLTPGVPGGVGYAVRASRAHDAVRALKVVDQSINVAQGTYGAVDQFQQGNYGWSAFNAGMAGLGARSLAGSPAAGRIGRELAESSSHLANERGSATIDFLTGGLVESLRGTQKPLTKWAARTGRAYERRFRRFWHQFEGKSVGDWAVDSVNRRLAEGIAPDLVLRNMKMKRVVVFDLTSAKNASHMAKGERYAEHLKKMHPGYEVEYHEGYWRGLEDQWEALSRDGRLYFPSETRPK